MAEGNIKLILRQQRLHPAEAEVWVTVLRDSGRAITDIDGRFVGPRCRYASTVQVAYPLRPLPQPADDSQSITRRVVIPEPSMWTPQTPFLYQALLNLIEGERRAESLELVHGLRTLELRWNGISLNGRRFVVQGVAADDLSDAKLEDLRRQEINTLLLQTTDANIDLWDQADRFGFFVIGRVASDKAMTLALMLGQHPCSLGWLVDQGVVDGLPAELAGWQRFGLHVHDANVDVPGWASFLAGEPETLSKLQNVVVPKLSLGQTGDQASMGCARLIL